MTILAYIIGGINIGLALFLILQGGSASQKKTRQNIMLALGSFALWDFFCASEPSLVAPSIALEVVAFIRFVCHDMRISFGTGDSRSILRHTEHVLRKSIVASVFTDLMLIALLAVFGQEVHVAVMAWPLLFAVEFGLRQLRSHRIKKEEAARQKK